MNPETKKYIITALWHILFWICYVAAGTGGIMLAMPLLEKNMFDPITRPIGYAVILYLVFFFIFTLKRYWQDTAQQAFFLVLRWAAWFWGILVLFWFLIYGVCELIKM